MVFICLFFVDEGQCFVWAIVVLVDEGQCWVCVWGGRAIYILQNTGGGGGCGGGGGARGVVVGEGQCFVWAIVILVDE